MKSNQFFFFFNISKNSYIFFSNEKLLADYLENFPKILKFDVVISCLIPSEKEG